MYHYTIVDTAHILMGAGGGGGGCPSLSIIFGKILEAP